MKGHIHVGVFFLLIAIALSLQAIVGIKILDHWGLSELWPPLTAILYTLAIALPIVMGITTWRGYQKWHPLNAFLNLISCSWFIFSLSLFGFGLFVYSLYWVGLITGNLFPKNWLIITMTTLVLSWSIYGLINAKIIRFKTVTLSVPPSHPLTGKRIILISDLHLGMHRGEKFLARLVKKINNTKPDIILIAGDLIDGPFFPIHWLKKLNNLETKEGIFYTPGNHEKYHRSPKLIYSALPKNINLLQNKLLRTASGIAVLGLDYQKETQNKLEQRTKKVLAGAIPDIILLHDPANRDALASTKARLVVSGHTHGGQFFPSTFLIRLKYKSKNKGLVRKNKTDYYTTVGLGCSVVPVRIGTSPEIVVFDYQ